MVWSPQGKAPTFRHTSRASADAEAARLAALHTDRDFFVLKAVAGVTAEAPKLRQFAFEPFPGTVVEYPGEPFEAEIEF